MKRVAVVVSSVIFFKNPVSPLNWAGSALAIFGCDLSAGVYHCCKVSSAVAQAEATKMNAARMAWQQLLACAQDVSVLVGITEGD